MIDLNELKKLAEAATPGPWERDTIRSDGEYGTDDDGGFGFDTYEVTDNTGQCIMDCTNNDNGCVEVGHDGHAWDEVAKHNAAFVAAANPVVILELIALASATQDSAPAELPPLPGCLADRLYEAIGIAHNRAEHAGSTPRMKKWDATAADLRAALASPQPVAKVLADEDKWHSLTCDGTCSPPCKDAPLPPAVEMGGLSDDQLDCIARAYFADEHGQTKAKGAIHDALKMLRATTILAASTPTTLTEPGNGSQS